MYSIFFSLQIVKMYGKDEPENVVHLTLNEKFIYKSMDDLIYSKVWIKLINYLINLKGI